MFTKLNKDIEDYEKLLDRIKDLPKTDQLLFKKEARRRINNKSGNSLMSVITPTPTPKIVTPPEGIDFDKLYENVKKATDKAYENLGVPDEVIRRMRNEDTEEVIPMMTLTEWNKLYDEAKENIHKEILEKKEDLGVGADNNLLNLNTCDTLNCLYIEEDYLKWLDGRIKEIMYDKMD